VPFEREDLFAAHGVTGERSVTKTGSFDFAVLFGLVLEHVDDSAEIERPHPEVSREDRDARAGLEPLLVRERSQTVDGEELPRKERLYERIEKRAALADEAPHVIDAPARRRSRARGADVRIRKVHRPPRGELSLNARRVGLE